MKIPVLRKLFSIGIGVWLLVTSAVIAYPVTSHAIDHQHTPHNHSQTWCDWICKASNAIHTPSIVLDQSFDILTPKLLAYSIHHPSAIWFSTDSRAPPGLFYRPTAG